MEAFIPAAPLFVVFIGAIIGVAMEGAVPRLHRPTIQSWWTALVIVAALGWTAVDWNRGQGTLSAKASLAIDGPTWAAWVLLLFFGLLSLLLFADHRVGGGESPFVASASAVPASQAERDAIAARQEQTEVYPLLLFSLTGMMSFIAANDMITMFVSLEIFSFPLYILASLARRRRLLSQEAALKYFLLGALSSALFLYGLALLYGFSGSFFLRDIDSSITSGAGSEPLLLAGMGLVSVGILFKLGAVPFHNWVPDVYTGSPTPVTGFMAICTKLAAAVGLLRILYVALGAMRWDWQLYVAVIAVLTMLAGGLIGLMQTDVKRLMAYSSIAHAGFILTGVVGATTVISGLAEGRIGSVASVLFYLAAYGLPTLGTFAIIALVRRSGAESSGFDAWAGLGRRRPVLGVAMTIFLLSMAGMPLTGGLIAKIMVFAAAWQGHYQWLVVVAVVASLVTAGFYFRVIWVLFGEAPSEQTAVVQPGAGTWTVIWTGIIGTFVLGVCPGPLLEVLNNAAVFLR
ncbi:proton-translocating NADH-quinone oxidoreductase, chain N [Propionibacterium sp. oral taxon 192 str. F0372]|uniref:NADH-quinone oxidoreductase subunit NuoN n=1 Tax=Propionibacterium sp. oral taxon 192 TaxID=671222 RepID=UPI000353FABA|nr:NADH-quinone oxidoreductase subunit NuoN [Propionibacterium sp. oral taxon 192]EPH07174.1 proton-translocating NADH-quinone oxidoreductase, chain N [Propionibacterium sp. oral taxon 192 str. F0372]